MKVEIFDKNNKKNDALISEIFEINRLKMVKKNTKYIEIQHGMINYDLEQKNRSFEINNKELSDKNNKLVEENNKIVEENQKFKKLINNIDNLINDEAYE